MTFEKQMEMISIASMVCDTVVTQTLNLFECRNQLIYIFGYWKMMLAHDGIQGF